MLHQRSMTRMEQSKPRALAAGRSRWLLPLLLYLAVAVPAGLPQARAQPDSNGFITVDCGLAGPSYVSTRTKLTYYPDDAFTDAGENRNIAPQYYENSGMIFKNVRSFPNGTRNCYTLGSLVAGNKHLLRARFMYGNYDGLSRPPIFDLYIGVNFWTTVDASNSDEDEQLWWEAIVLVPDDFVQVCLVNTGTGMPFISELELRPLKSSLYPQVNSTQGLNLRSRRNFGPTDAEDIVRYPDDPYDRIWYPHINTTNWNVTSTDKRVQYFNNDVFEAPSKVLQTAIIPRIASDNIHFRLNLDDPQPNNIYVLHFCELEHPRGKDVRQFYTIINDDLQLRYPQQQGFIPAYLYANWVYSPEPFGGYNQYNASVITTANSTLPPIINAYEVFHTISTTNIGTHSQDLSAITVIKKKYGVNENWMGDPCAPTNLTWKGLLCSSATSGLLRIVGVNMSFSGLNGNISSAFANLTAIQYMDLSHNNLTGFIPHDWSQLPSLTVLDLTGNQLSGTIPLGLLQKIQDGSLNLTYGDNPNLCSDGDSCRTTKMKSKLAIYVAIPIALVVVIALVPVLFYLLRRKKQGDDAHSSLRLENRRFTYKELERITNNFHHVIGRGGFGKVYSGVLEDGTQVAVKLRSESSNQGVKEFVTEAQILTRIHHKNLVSMIGYCKDGEYMALVYEYMSEGSLQKHILGKHLTWRQRLRIALESAQGLEYLHKGCNPPLIHRDVKTTNILLNAKLEAKVADFGLSRAFNLDICTHVLTNALVGTVGYVDPEYTKRQCNRPRRATSSASEWCCWN